MPDPVTQPDPWAGPVPTPTAPAPPPEDQASGGGVVLLWDKTSNSPAGIPLSQYEEALASGRYSKYEGTVLRTQRLGATVTNDPGSALGRAEPFVSGHASYEASVKQTQRDAFDTFDDKAFSFIEGIGDSLTFGVLKQRGALADLRRDVNSGSTLAGNLAGLATALVNPGSSLGALAKVAPAAKVMRGSEAIGKSVAKSILGEAKFGEKGVKAFGRRALDEGTANAVYAGVAALGHSATDALIENKPLAGETIASAMGSDFLIGSAFGGVAALFGRARGTIKAREAITNQSGILDAASTEGKAFRSSIEGAVSSVDETLSRNEAVFGAMSAFDEAGELGVTGPDALRTRRQALEKARRLAKSVKKIDWSVFDGDDMRKIDQSLELLDRYQASVFDLDGVMRDRTGMVRPRGSQGTAIMDGAVPVDARAQFQQADTPRNMPSGTSPYDAELTPPGRDHRAGVYDAQLSPADQARRDAFGPAPGEDGPVPNQLQRMSVDELVREHAGLAHIDPDATTRRQLIEEGGMHEIAQQLDIAMAANPEAAAKYREIYGRDWVPIYDQLHGPTPSLSGKFDLTDEAAGASLAKQPVGFENLGGKVTPSSGVGTNAGTVKARKTPEAGPAPELPPAGPTGEMGAETGRLSAIRTAEMPGVPRDPALPDRAPSSLEAFAYDVQAAGARLAKKGGDEVSLEAIAQEMMARPGRAPKAGADMTRFRELVGEAQMAGYLKTAGKGAEIPHLGEYSPGDKLVIDPEFVGRDPVKFNKADRFKRWGDQGNQGKAPPTEKAIEAAVEVGGVDAPAPAPGGKPGKAVREPKTQKDMGTEGALAEALRVADERASGQFVKAAPEPQAVTPGTEKAARAPRGPSALADGRVDRYLEALERGKPSMSAADEAANTIRDAIRKLEEITGGRLNNDLAHEAAIAAGLKDRPRGQLAQQIAAVVGLRQLARAAAGGAQGARKAGKGSRASTFDRLVQRSGAAAGRAVVFGSSPGKAAFAAGVGVATGSVFGALIGGAIGAAGGLAGNVGRARDAVIKAGDALLKGRRSRFAAGVPRTVAYSYNGDEPTEDIAVRVQQLQEVIQNPDAVRELALEAMGDFKLLHPEISHQAADVAVRKLEALSLRAPKFVWDAMGNPRAIGQQSIRKFLEAEEVFHHPESFLADVAAGTVSRAKVEAYRDFNPEGYAVLVKHLLNDPEALHRLPRERKAVVQMITGLQLTKTSPEYIARQQVGYELPQPAAQSGPGPRPPAATPAQSLMAPGN